MSEYEYFTNEDRGRLALCPICGRPIKTEKSCAMPDGMWMRCKCGFRAFVFKCQEQKECEQQFDDGKNAAQTQTTITTIETEMR